MEIKGKALSIKEGTERFVERINNKTMKELDKLKEKCVQAMKGSKERYKEWLENELKQLTNTKEL